MGNSQAIDSELTTPAEIAERFIGSGANIEMRRERCAAAIEELLRQERERAAKIAEQDSVISWAGGSTGDAKGTAKRIASAIRQPDPPEVK